MSETITKDHDCNTEGPSFSANISFNTCTSSSLLPRLRWRKTAYVSIFISISKKSSSHRGAAPPNGDGQFSRTSSSRSYVAVDVPSDRGEQGLGDDEEEDPRITLARIVENKDLEGLRRFGGVTQAAAVLGSDLERGINNRDPVTWSAKKRVFFKFLLEACNSITVLLLIISGGLSFAIGFAEDGPQYGWHVGAVILLAVFLLVAFTSMANYRSAKEHEKKLLKENELKVNVVREGQSQQLTVPNIVAGDIVILNKGDRVLADGLLVDGNGLLLDEALGSRIDCDENPFLPSGSEVKEGHGRMLVTAVGTETALGKVLGLVTHDPNKETLLQAQIHKPMDYTDKLALVISILISLVLLLRLLDKKHVEEEEVPELKGKLKLAGLMKIFEKILFRLQRKISVIIAALVSVVIGLQHGMFFFITVSLSYWREKMKPEASPQNLSACGTAGLVTVVVCADTAGGLESNQMEVNKFWIGERDIKDGEVYPLVLEHLRCGINVSVLVPEIPVSPTDKSLISWAKLRWGMELPEQSSEFLMIKLCSREKACGVLMRKNGDDEKIMRLHWKGDASAILGMCSSYYDCQGGIYPMENQKRKFVQVVKNLGDGGCRTIALACTDTEIEEVREDGLNLLAIVGICCTKSAVESLRNAGVNVKLVSESESSDVRELACELGIHRPESDDVVLEGVDFRNLGEVERKDIVDKITVMGSSSPRDKLFMVQSLKDKGHVVAFFGGTTVGDIPALKEADLGITGSNRSTKLAKESCDIVIQDKGLISLAPVILKYGRCVCRNIQTFIQLQLTATISGLLITLIATIALGDSPLTAVQLIWVNFTMSVLGGLMLVMKPLSQGVLNNPPAKRTESLIRKILWNIIAQVLYQAIVLLIFHFEAQHMPGMNQDVRDAFIFNTFTLCQVFNLFNGLNLEKKEVLKNILQEYWFLLAVVAVGVTQFLLVQYGTSMADCARMNSVQWSLSFLVAALSWGFDRAMVFSFLNLHCGSVSSRFMFSGRRPLPFAIIPALPCCMCLLLSYYLNPAMHSGIA